MPVRKQRQVSTKAVTRASVLLLHAYTGHDGDVAPSLTEQQRRARTSPPLQRESGGVLRDPMEIKAHVSRARGHAREVARRWPTLRLELGDLDRAPGA